MEVNILEKMDIEEVNKTIFALIAVVSLSTNTLLKDLARRLNDFVSKCMSMAWDKGAIARVGSTTHTSIIAWIKQIAAKLPDAYIPEQLPQVGELDELETFVGRKKNQVWIRIRGRSFSARDLGLGRRRP